MIIDSMKYAPDLDSDVLILDFETGSGSTKKMSVNPWHNCRIAGTGLTSPSAADRGLGYYFPTCHTTGDSPDGIKRRAPDQLEEVHVAQYLYDQLRKCNTIIGHNIKYDLHVLCNNWGKFHPFSRVIADKKVIDTLTHAKLVDSDRWTYGLKKLSVDWLSLEDHSDPLAPYLKTPNGQTFNKDFSQIPVDICGKYCIQDILTTWKLEQYCSNNMMTQAAGVWETEQKLTSILFQIERVGTRVDLQRLELLYIYAGRLLIVLQEEIHKLLVSVGCSKKYIKPHKNDDCFQVLCSHFGLPVLQWTTGGKDGKSKKPSFDKHALNDYLNHPEVLSNAPLQQIILKIQNFRKWHTINGLFLEPYRELHIEGLLHGDFNQCIRTGRMAMSRPNLQQVPLDVRYLIPPWDQSEEFREQYVGTAPDGRRLRGMTAAGAVSDESIVVRDASQIEFRLIVNYCRNRKAVQAYKSDPATDYHQFMADLCSISRKPAKNINFMLSFGGGKYKCLSMLKDSLNLLGNYGHLEKQKYEGRILVVPEVKWKGKIIQQKMVLEGFDAFCWEKASSVYSTYHRTLPELKKISWKAQRVLLDRGYLVNLYGRVRKLPSWASNKSFNNIIQSSAADLLKERTVALWNYLESEGVLFHGHDSESPAGLIKLFGIVHDELDTSEPTHLLQNKSLQEEILHILESPTAAAGPSPKLDIPISWNTSVDKISWAGCK